MALTAFAQRALAPILAAALLSPGLLRAADVEKTIYRFKGGTADGQGPMGGLLLGKNGDLFGTTLKGGSATYGVVYALHRLATGRWSESAIHVFTGPPADGAGPYSSLIADARGHLFGTTRWGGAGFHGTVFELQHTSGRTWTETVIHSFRAKLDGAEPIGSLVMDDKGNLYGTTLRGGPTTNGTVFVMQPVKGGGWTEAVIHSFGGGKNDGALPQAGLTMDASGNLFGTTSAGGEAGMGTVFELSPEAGGTWTETVLHSFAGGSNDGASPASNLAIDQAGNLYGTTPAGGPRTNSGVVFELSPSGGTWTAAVIYAFGVMPGDASAPAAGLTLDANGNLYGTTSGGGASGYGTVFELTPGAGGWTENLLYSFGAVAGDGKAPLSGVIFGNGVLYGTASKGGGSKHGGTVFSLTQGPF